MDRYQIPGTELHVTRVGLGTMTFGEQVNEADSHRILSAAVDQGVNFLDTAEMYPIPPREQTAKLTETFIGRWLAQRDRSQLVIATKVAGPGRGMKGIRVGERETLNPLSARDIELACEESLRRLQTDYIDLYQIHWPARNTPTFGQERFDPSKDFPAESIETQLVALDRLVRAGKVRAIGVSNETTWGLGQWLATAQRLGLPRVATIQNLYNLMARNFEQGLEEACHHENVGLLAYSPLGMGYLTGKYRHGFDQPNNLTGRMSLFGRKWPRYTKPRIAPAVERYHAIAEANGLSLTQLALAFCYHRPCVASTLIGVTTEAQLSECLQAWQVQLSAEALSAIDEVHAELTNPAP